MKLTYVSVRAHVKTARRVSRCSAAPVCVLIVLEVLVAVVGCAEHLTVESYTIIIISHTVIRAAYSITLSLFHSRLKSFLFCKSSLPQPFLFLLQNSLCGFSRVFTITSEHIRLFYFLLFFCFNTFFSCRFRAVD